MNEFESIIVTLVSLKEYFFIDFLEDTIDLCVK
jgi:hypothetical protein